MKAFVFNFFLWFLWDFVPVLKVKIKFFIPKFTCLYLSIKFIVNILKNIKIKHNMSL